jgi:hypothetical protein
MSEVNVDGNTTATSTAVVSSSRPPPARNAVVCDESIITEGKKKLEDLIHRLQLTRPNHPLDPFTSMTVMRVVTTQKAYKDKWKEMMKFFYMIGDYQSAMLVDRDLCPNNPLPFQPNSFATYLDYRCGEPGSILKKPNGDDQLDVRGQRIHVIGGWNSPSSLWKMHAAVLFIHETAYPESCGGSYQSSCAACQHLNLALGSKLQTAEEEDSESEEDDDCMDSNDHNSSGQVAHALGLFRSCVDHANRPVLRAKGCILNHPATKNHYKAWLKCIQKKHVTKGCGQLFPSDVRRIRSHLLARGDPVSIQAWVMLLLGIRLFLRADELVEIEVQDFVDSYYPDGKTKKQHPGDGKNALTKCQVVGPGSVEAIAFEVHGKCDDRPVRLVLFSDDEYPEFCPVRHLLWYLKIFNITGGYLFPKNDTLIKHWNTSRNEELQSSDHISYGSFLSLSKSLVTTICGRDEKIFVVGTHTLRKTAYLFAVWGFLRGLRLGSYADFSMPQMQMCLVVKSARHKTVNNVSTYMKDASTLYELNHRERHSSDNEVGAFHSIFLEIGNHGSAITSSTPYQKALPELAQWWYSSCLGLKDRPVGNRPVEILYLACNHRPQLHGMDLLQARLTTNIHNANEVNEIMDIFRGTMAEHTREAVASIHLQLEEARAQSTQPSQEVLVSVTGKKKDYSGNVQFSETKLQKSIKGNDRIEFLLAREREFQEKTGGQKSKLTEAAKRWYNRHIVKCLVCLNTHLKGDRAAFLDIYGATFMTTTWTCRCPQQQHTS